MEMLIGSKIYKRLRSYCLDEQLISLNLCIFKRQ